MKRNRICGIAAIAILFANLLGCETIHATTSETPPAKVSHDLAAEFAEVTSPPDAMREDMRRSAAASIDRGLAQDPELPSGEKKYPGLSAAMKAAGLAAVEPVIDEACRDLALRQRDLVARSFTVPELRDLLAFYKTSAAIQGQAAAVAAARSSLNPSTKLKMMEKAGTGTLSSKDIGVVTNSPSATPKLSRSVEEAYRKFSNAPVARKLPSFNAANEALLTQWANGTAPRVQSTIRDAMIKMVGTYIASHN